MKYYNEGGRYLPEQPDRAAQYTELPRIINPSLSYRKKLDTLLEKTTREQVRVRQNIKF